MRLVEKTALATVVAAALVGFAPTATAATDQTSAEGARIQQLGGLPVVGDLPIVGGLLGPNGPLSKLLAV
ncbi:hypothetical protein [Amycolatopsis sp. cmx-11-32]|uniref:hypothetical protein n=1 Tax=Amycolatopsis sp. cmx-11-32 TaxID=2785796 RepID=UPI0039E46FFA